MSAKTKQKYVYREHLENFDSLSEQQLVGRITKSCGSNLMEVLDSNGQVYLASLPSKFRKNIWLRRGSFVVLEPIAEGRKVRAEVVRVLAERQISEMRRDCIWPAAFADDPAGQLAAGGGVGGGLEAPPFQVDLCSDGGSLNRRLPVVCESDSGSSDEDTSDSLSSDDPAVDELSDTCGAAVPSGATREDSVSRRPSDIVDRTNPCSASSPSCAIANLNIT